MKKRALFIKICVIIVICFAYSLYLQAYEPTFTNEMALQQMQNHDTSSSGIMAYTYLRNYGWVVMVVLAVTLFWRDAIDLFKKLTKNTNASKGEQNYEEKDSE